jgi:hypothetical protein
MTIGLASTTAWRAILLGMTVVQNNERTTQPGGITGRGFKPGVSGNPGGRPKGLARRVRELVGEDGHAIAAYMFTVMSDEASRTADRMEAARWLADRGFGRAVQGLEIDVNPYPALDITKLSLADLEALLEIVDRYEPEAADAESGEVVLDISGAEPPARSGRGRSVRR